MKRIICCLLLILTALLCVGCDHSISKETLEEYANKIVIQSEVNEDFHLVRTVGENNDIYVSWTSSHPSVIKIGNLATVDGVSYFTAKVVLPVEDTKVTLTALLETTDGTINFEKTFEVTVKARPAEGKWKSVSFAIDEANKLDGSKNEKSKDKYLIKGTVKDIVKEEYCNFNLTDGNQTILVFGLYTADGKDPYGTKEGYKGIPFKVGDTIYLYTNLQNYGGTLELKSAWLVDENFDPSTIKPVDYETKTIAEALAIAKGLKGDSQEITTESYYISGTVKNIVKEEYCNFNLTDGTNTILVYGITNESGAKYGTQNGFLGIPIKVGDIVKLRTQIQNYNGTYELKNAVLISVTEGTETPVEVKQVTVKEAIAAAEGTDLKVVGVVTTVLGKGFIITDATGSMNVFGTATVELNQKVEVVGVKAKYYNLPQISLTSYEVKGTETIDLTYKTYKYEELPTNFTDPDFYATYVLLEGEVVENTGDLNTPYTIMPSGSSVGFLISKYTNESALAELKENVGKYVIIKAVVYDSKDNVWRFAYQNNSLQETSAPEITNEQKFTYVKTQLEQEFNGMTVRKNMTLPTTGKYDTVIEWASNNEAISNTGVFTAPKADTEVTLTAVVKVGETVIGTVEIKVTAKAQSGEVGASYKYEFKSKDDQKFTNEKTDQTALLGNLNWRLVNDSAKGYIGFDSVNGKGLQIGSKANPAANINMSTEEYEGKVQHISVVACGASKISESTTITIKIGGVVVGTGAITSTAGTTYSYDCDASGTIEIIITGADKAAYITSIAIN